MKNEINVTHDPLTQQLLSKASPVPDFKADFTAQVMAQIEVQTQAQRAKIYEPLLPVRVWRYIGITLSSLILLVLGLSVLAFGPKPELHQALAFATSLKDALTTNQLNYLPELLLIGIICFCWLFLDYLYGQLRKT